MKLKADFEEEYKKRHDEIWPEPAKELKNAAASDYSIFLDEETQTRFAVQKLSSDNTANDLPRKMIVRKWRGYMSGIMEVNPDNSPVITGLKKVFYLE